MKNFLPTIERMSLCRGYIKYLLILSFLFFHTQNTFSQADAFQKIFGDSVTSDRGVTSLLIDDQILMLGNTANPLTGDIDIELVSLTLDGTISWRRTYGTGNNDIVHKMILNEKGEVVIVGETQNSSATISEGFVFVTDANGEEILFETYDDRDKNLFFNDIKLTIDDHYIVCGFISGSGFGNDYLIIKMDKEGEIIWQKTIGTDINEVGVSIYPLENGNYFVSGDKQQSSQGPYGIEVLGLDSLGNVLWQTDINDFANGGCKNMIRNSKGQFIIVGEAVPVGQNAFDVIIANVDEDGTLNSQVFIPATINGDAGFAILELEDQDAYLVTGYSHNAQTSETEVFLSQLDDQGIELDRKYYGISGIGYDLIRSPQGGFILTGAVFDGTDPQYFLALDYPLITSTGELEKINQPTLYPTLVDKNIQELTLSEAIPNASVAIYNAMGLLMGTYDSVLLNSIPLRNLDSGMYWIQINSKDTYFTEQVLITE